MSERYRNPDPIRVAPGELTIAPLFPDAQPARPAPQAPTPEQIQAAEEAKRRDEELQRWQQEQERTAPGRYELVPRSELEARQDQWRRENAASGVAGDAWRGAQLGADSTANALREIVRAIPKVGPAIVAGVDAIDRWRTGRDSETLFNERRDMLTAQMTPETRAARDKKWIDERQNPDGSTSYSMGAAWADPRAYLSGLTESAASTAITMLPAAAMARGAYLSAIAKGAGERAAAAAASRTALIAGGVGEGLISGGQTSAEIREQIGKLPEATLNQSEAYRSLLQAGRSPAEARAALTDDLATRGMLIAGVATGLFGGQGDRVLARIVAEGVQGGLGRRILAGGARGAVAEGLLEELPQSASEQIAQNYAMQGADPHRRLMQDVPNAAAGGAVVGGLMGSGFGGAGGAARARPDTAADAAAPGELAAPAATPAPAAPQPAPRAPMTPEERGVAAGLGDPSAARGPLSAAIDHGTRQTGQRPTAAPAGGPAIGSDITVNVPGGEQIAARVEGYSPDGEAMVRAEVADRETGEIRRETLQVPLSAIATPGTGRTPATETSTAPARADTVPLAERPAMVTQPGQRVLVDDPTAAGLAGATVQSFESGGTEALVRRDDGTEVQVPTGNLRVNGLSGAAIAARELKEKPPVPREALAGGNSLAREVRGAQVELPDQVHAALYDLGKLRHESKRTLGKGALDLDTDAPMAAQTTLAEKFGVSPQRLAQIAEDYRYRVERAAREATTRTPVKMHAVNDKLLGRLRAEDAREAKAAGTVDAAANEAATSPNNTKPQPTEAQKEAGNYSKGHIRLGGMDISIENPAGSQRSGTDRRGKAWSVTMKSHYGYFRGTIGRDKDHVDTFIRAGTTSLTDGAPAFVVDQVNPGGTFDEHKVMLGFDSREQAQSAYRANYAKGWKGLGAITETTVGDLKRWFAEGDTTKPFAPAREPSATKAAEPAAAPPAAEPAPAPPEPAAEKPAQFGENKIFTADKVAAARERLRAKLRQVNSGIDPEVLVDGMTIAGAYIESGVRSFSAYAKRMVEDLGPQVRPYLLSFWEAVRHYPGLDTAGMTPAEESARLHSAGMAAPEASQEESGGRTEPLDRAGEEALAGQPADAVSRPETGGDAGHDVARGGRGDLSGDQPARGERVPAGRGLPDGAGKPSVPAGRTESREADERGAEPERAAEPAAAGNERSTAGRTGRGRRADNGDGARARNEPVKPQPAGGIEAAGRPTNYTITDRDEIGVGGAKRKFRQNIAAIRVIRQLADEARTATRDEQAVLARWVGWGGLRSAFAREDGSVAKGWEREAAELKELLTPEEYRAAESSTRNAHYTSPEIVRAMWSAVRRLGFAGGQVLEPSVGAGNFIGLSPAVLRAGTRFTGVELDRLTGSIARNLYLDANIQAPLGFQDLAVPDGHFDLAIGNPPFGSERVHDAARRQISQFSIHNYFLAKSIDGVKPGGVLAMVVTNRFLDGANPAPRQYIAARADLVGAIRLPNNAFAANAGTEVTTDVVFLRRRKEGEAAGNAAWTNVGDFRDKEGRTVPLNRYFIENPGMMLGDFGAHGSMYRADDAALVARPGEELGAELEKAINRLPQNIMEPPGRVAEEKVAVPTNVAEAAEGSMFLDPDGTVWERQPDVLGEHRARPVQFANATAAARVAHMVRVRDAFARLRRAQLDPAATDTKLDTLRERLNKVYDAFVAKHGPINADANKRLFRDDPTWPQISALEVNFSKGVGSAAAKATGEKARPPSADKAPIFTRRTQQPYARPTSASSARDALAQVLSDRGRVDMDEMVRLYGRPEAAIVDELGPLIYRTPAGAWEPADLYLSGNVKTKLAEAERAAAEDPAFRRNVDALRDVQPADIEAVDIDVKAGAPWVPAEHVGAFLDHVSDARGGTAYYSRGNAKWVLVTPKPSAAAQEQWGTDRVSVARVLEAAINGDRVVVQDKVSDGSSVINQQATDAANEKIQRTRDEWRRWIWQDDGRREQLARLYNDTFNTDVETRYDGSHLSLPGKVSDDIISLRPHQKNAVWRASQSGVVLFDHTVGAGKTFAAISAIMELRRTGRAKKPMVVVPNHLVGQWAADFVRLYPGAQVLAPTERDFEKERRQRLFARIATGDWDAVIIAHSSFKRLGVSPEYEAAFIQEQVDDLDGSLRELRSALGEGSSRNVAALSKQRDGLKTRLQKLLDTGSKDRGLVWEDLGIDALAVDEAHEFKNLAYSSSMQRVAGLGDPLGSQKAADLFIKVRHLLETTGGRNLLFLTGTPISNSMVEMYTLMRYLDGRTLKAMGLAHFDAWAKVFGEVVTDWELSPTGQYRLNQRFARFTNVPELMQRYRSFADVITNDDIKAMLAAEGKRFPLPKVKGGRPQNIVVEPSDDQVAYVGEAETDESGVTTYPEGTLIYRAENLPRRPEPGSDNMLKIMSDARKSALDMRLIDGAYGDAPASKVHRAADEMVRIYRASQKDRGTQLVFIDLSTPQSAKKKEAERIRALIAAAETGDDAAQQRLDAMSPDELSALDGTFSVYDDLRAKLIARGIPAGEIAFIHDANTDLAKQELFGKVRAGSTRFLFGSTPKMGAGTNVQNRLVALHHLDAPWRPSDLEQRDGRGIRQGNELFDADPDGFEIEILRYATRRTLDARQWQTIEAKARFVEQLRRGDVKSRTIEDIAGEAANAAEMKAASSGNPLILEEMTVRQKVRRLEGAEVEHDREQHRVRGRIRAMTEERAKIAQALPAAEADAATARASEPLAASIERAPIDKPKDLGAAVIAVARRMIAAGEDERVLGTLGEFTVAVQHVAGDAVNVVLRGAGRHEIHVTDVSEADATGLGMRAMNTVRRMIDAPTQLQARAAEIERQLPKLESQIGPFEDAAALDAARTRHQQLIAELRPKPKPAAPAEGKASIGESVATIDGTELGVEFRGPEDMPALRRAAAAWYDRNLFGTTAAMADGTTVGFTRRGLKKTTSGGKGDILLRAVPAIRAIVERGQVVFSEPGTRPDILERAIVSATVDFAGRPLRLAVSIHKTRQGNWQYDFNFDRDAGSPGVGVPGGTADRGLLGRPVLDAAPGVGGPGIGTRLAPDADGTSDSGDGTADKASLAETSGGLNLFVWDGGAETGADVRADLGRGPLGGFVNRLIETGRVKIVDAAPAGTPAGVQGWTTPDGTISLVAPALAGGQAMPVLLHEMFHAGVRPLIGSAAWGGLMDRLGRLHRQFAGSSGGARAIYDRAQARVERTGISGELAAEEFGAYAIEEYEAAPRALRGWIDDVIGRVKAWALARFGAQIGRVTPAQLRALAVAALRSQSQGEVVGRPFSVRDGWRRAGIPAAAAMPIATFRNTEPLKAHVDYADAKAGDMAAAARLVRDLVRPEDLAAAADRFGSGVIYAPVVAEEITGRNRIPSMLAARYAQATGNRDATDIVQSNRAYHTGAGPMERVATRTQFSGPVERGGRYVLVDDVSVMGSTIADLANHIQAGGGEVVGVVMLVNGSRAGVLTPTRSVVRDIEGRFGNAVRDLFQVDPAGLTADEAAYIRNFRDADALRARAAAAERERSERLRSKGVLGGDGASPAPVTPADRRYSLNLSRQDVADTVKGWATDIQPKLLATVPLNYFSELARPGMTSIDAYLKSKRDMDTYRGNRHEAMVSLAEDWRRFASANRRGAEQLAALMHDATLAGFDPDHAKAERGHQAQEALVRQWQALPPAAHALYRRVRDAYVAQQDELDTIILANVDKAHLAADRKADQAYRSAVDRVRRDGSLLEPEKRERIEALDAKREADRSRSLWGHRARMTRLRQKFESSRLPAPYFPLSRFGRYFVTIKDAEGHVVSFSRFEREAERRRWVRENWTKIQGDLPGLSKEEGVIDNAAEMGAAMDSRIIGELSTLLDGAGVDASVMDAVWQRYLSTMPDLSIRKRYIHRKGRAGFQADALKGFASHMFHAAHQMARLKYGADLVEAVNGAAEEAKRSDDPTRGGTLVNELRKRHEWVMNPTGSRAVQAVTSAMFVWYLGATPAAAIVNMTQPIMLGVPILGTRLGGMAKATAALMRAARETVTGRGSIADAASLTAQERAAVAAFYDSGLIERSQSHDLAGIGDTGVEYSPLRHKVMTKIGWAFHRAEVWNREVTALAAYRLAREAGQPHREAIDTAHDLTWKVNFDYSNSNRPRILQNDAAKLIGVFQNFQINMWYRLFRDIHQSFKGDTTQARSEARYQLAGIMGMMALMGGLTGVAGYNVLMAVAGMAMGNDDDPFEFKHRVEKSIVDLFGPMIGGIILKGAPGHLTGLDLTARIGMPDVFLRAPDGNKDGRNWWRELIFNAIGVVPSTVLNVADGMKMVGEGKVARGAEMIVPKALRDLMKAYRYANEGVQSRRGDEVVPRERISAWDVIAQATGFTPAHIAETYERGSRLREAQFKVQQERRELLNRWAMAARLGDAEARRDAFQRIQAWNARSYARGIQITADTLRQSLAARARASARRDDGVVIQNQRLSRTLREGLGGRLNQ